VEDIVAESSMDVNPSPRKRQFQELENGDNQYVTVKTERSMSSSSTGTTNSCSMGYIKMEIDMPNTNAVDEETSNAASILNGVSMEHRAVLFL
jgi:hypothetical protein